MEALITAIVGLNVTLVGALVWLLKASFTRFFGNANDPGIISQFNATLQTMTVDIKENTSVIRGLQETLKEKIHGQATTGPDGPLTS